MSSCLGISSEGDGFHRPRLLVTAVAFELRPYSNRRPWVRIVAVVFLLVLLLLVLALFLFPLLLDLPLLLVTSPLHLLVISPDILLVSPLLLLLNLVIRRCMGFPSSLSSQWWLCCCCRPPHCFHHLYPRPRRRLASSFIALSSVGLVALSFVGLIGGSIRWGRGLVAPRPPSVSELPCRRAAQDVEVGWAVLSCCPTHLAIIEPVLMSSNQY